MHSILDCCDRPQKNQNRNSAASTPLAKHIARMTSSLESMFPSIAISKFTNSKSKLVQDIQTERKFRLLLSVPPGTEMFHFPGCAPAYTGYR